MSKSSFTVLKASSEHEGKEKYLFYVVPTARVSEFLSQPSLIHTSTYAKSLYEVPYHSYQSNKAYHDNAVSVAFHSHEPYLGVIGASEDSH